MSFYGEIANYQSLFKSLILLFTIFFTACSSKPHQSYTINKIRNISPWRALHKKCRQQDQFYRDAVFAKMQICNYRKKIWKEPENPVWYFLYGRLLGLVGYPELSLHFFRLATQKDPDDLWGHYGLALYYLKKKDHFQARMYIKKCLLCNPDFAPALVVAAKLSMSKNRQKAISYMKQAVKILPDQANYHHNLAMVLLIDKQFSLAGDHFNKAVMLEPTNKTFLKSLALYYLKTNQKNKALRILRALKKAKNARK